MSGMTSERLEELRLIAEAATPGLWELDIREYGFRIRMGSAVPYKGIYEPQHVIEWDPGVYYDPGYPETGAENKQYLEAEANARHIATFDPPTVLAMLDEIERLRRGWETLAAAVRAWDDYAKTIIENGPLAFDAIDAMERAEQRHREALALLDGEKGGGGA